MFWENFFEFDNKILPCRFGMRAKESCKNCEINFCFGVGKVSKCF